MRLISNIIFGGVIIVLAYYRIRKKFRGVFNFVFFADDKDPRNFSIK